MSTSSKLRLGCLLVQRSQWHNRFDTPPSSKLVILVFCKCQQVSRPVFCKYQQGSGLRLVFCNCQQARNWDLAICQFRGRDDITGWETTKLEVVMEFGKRSRFHGEKRGNYCHRFNVNVTAKCICGLTILWMRIGKWFWRSRFHREKRGNCCYSLMLT